MSWLTLELISRNQVLRHEQNREIFIFPVQLTTSRIDNHARLIHTLLKVLTIYTYIHNCTCHGCIYEDTMFTVHVLYQGTSTIHLVLYNMHINHYVAVTVQGSLCTPT